MAKYIGKRIVPIHCGRWDQMKAYEMLSIVLEETSGDSYISRRAVPSGTAITDATFWTLHSKYSQQIKDMSDQLTAAEQRIKNDNDQTKADIIQDNDETVEEINAANAASENRIAANVDQAVRAMEASRRAFDESSASLTARLDAIVAESTVDSETEIRDARVDADGTEHENLGNAIRSIEPGVFVKLKKYVSVQPWNLCELAEELIPERYLQDGTVWGYGQFFTFSKIPVEPGTTYYGYCDGMADHRIIARFINCFDANGIFLENGCISYPRDPFTTPEGCNYVSISFVYKDSVAKDMGEYWFTDRVEAKRYDVFLLNGRKIKISDIEGLEGVLDSLDVIGGLSEGLRENTERIVEQETRLSRIEEEQADYAPVQLIRKPTFCFIYDDATEGDVNTKALFDSFGMKCGFAVISNGALESKLERYLQFQNDGFEILSHSTDGKGMSTSSSLTPEEVEDRLKSSIEQLSALGFNVNGWVTPSTWLKAEYLKLICKYYQYGFGHTDSNPEAWSGYHSFDGRDIRHLDRWSLQSHTIDETMTAIQNCITNCGFMCFYGHAYPSNDNMTEENMQTILSFLKAKADTGEIIVDIPRRAINNYYTFRHSDYIALLGGTE